jgi:hypothetical protein
VSLQGTVFTLDPPGSAGADGLPRFKQSAHRRCRSSKPVFWSL